MYTLLFHFSCGPFHFSASLTLISTLNKGSQTEEAVPTDLNLHIAQWIFTTLFVSETTSTAKYDDFHNKFPIEVFLSHLKRPTVHQRNKCVYNPRRWKQCHLRFHKWCHHACVVVWQISPVLILSQFKFISAKWWQKLVTHA